MKISSAEFTASVVHKKDTPSLRLPEVAFVGRSNVGKSSLINALVNRKRLVKVSTTPGRTQTINYFRINQRFYFVDLPGYGYARVPRAVRSRFGPMVEGYLEQNAHLACVVHIVDLRHRPTEGDRLMREYLLYHRIPILTVATKSDKLTRQQGPKQAVVVRETLEIDAAEPVFLFSARTSEGKRNLWSHLKAAMEALSERKGRNA
jgi:GTP-binding protein